MPVGVAIGRFLEDQQRKVLVVHRPISSVGQKGDGNAPDGTSPACLGAGAAETRPRARSTTVETAEKRIVGVEERGEKVVKKKE